MIAVLVYIVVTFTAFRLLIAFLNFIFREKLQENKTGEKLPSLSILVPARNEATNIGGLLSGLIEIKSSNIEEIIVCDDFSEDDTAGIVERYMAKDCRISLIRSEGPPDGWLGKNHACHRLAQAAKGDFLLFLDADVRISRDFTDRALSYIFNKKVDLLSIFPYQVMHTYAEKVSVPNMKIILLSLLLLPLVRLVGFTSVSAANGQCMLFNAKSYRAVMPHSIFKASRAEDIEIARHFKKLKLKVACITGVKSVQCRMYDSFKGTVEGFSKNVVFFFGGSYLGAILYWILTTLGWIPVLSCSVYLFLFYIGWEILIRIFVSLISRQNILENILLLIPQQMTLGVFIIKSLTNRSLIWKGRKI